MRFILLFAAVASLAACKVRQDQGSNVASASDTTSIQCSGTGMCVVSCSPGRSHRGADGLARCVDRNVPASVVDSGKVCTDELPAAFSQDDGCKAINPSIAGGGGGTGNTGTGNNGGGSSNGPPTGAVFPSCFKDVPEFAGMQFKVEYPFEEDPGNDGFADLCNNFAESFSFAIKDAPALGKYLSKPTGKPVVFAVKKSDQISTIKFDRSKRFLRIPVDESVPINAATVLAAIGQAVGVTEIATPNFAFMSDPGINATKATTLKTLDLATVPQLQVLRNEFTPELVNQQARLQVTMVAGCKMENGNDHFRLDVGGTNAITVTGECNGKVFDLPRGAGLLEGYVTTDSSQWHGPTGFQSIRVSF